MDKKDLTTWLEISESAYSKNLTFFKQRLPKHTEFSVVLKSNAYGHGILEIARLAVEHGADSFCVHALDEALHLHRNGFKQDILIMGPVMRSRLKEVVENNFRLILYNKEVLMGLKKITRELKKPVRVHLKLETGTYRQGIAETDLPEFLRLLKNESFIHVDGAYTHFANIEDTTNHEYAFRQLSLFKKMAKTIKDFGFGDIKCHTACSAAVLLFRETYFDMVRLGISQYGLWPSRETFVSYKMKHSKNGENILRPVLSWKTRVAQLKEVASNQNIGYGGTYQTTRPSRIAVLPIGYAEGYDRDLSNRGYVLIHGKRAPVRGRICMNLFMVDVTDIPEVMLEDVVTLIGRDGDNHLQVDYLAGLCGTINYEFTTRLNWQIPRIITA
ncbi:MAG: alanine racemase [bacterium]|nr:MAG: alanine racemase [bacterium]